MIPKGIYSVEQIDILLRIFATFPDHCPYVKLLALVCLHFHAPSSSHLDLRI